MYLAALRKLTVSVLSANLKKMEVLPFFLRLHQVYSVRIVVWDSKLLRHVVTEASWVHFKERKTKIGQKMSILPFLHWAFQLLFLIQCTIKSHVQPDR